MPWKMARPSMQLKQMLPSLAASWRVKITNLVREHKLFESEWVVDPTWTQALEDRPIPKTYAEWVDCLAKPKRWVDERMLAVGATLMQRSIVVFVWSANSWQKGWVIDPIRSFRKACKDVASKPPLPVLLKSRHCATLLKKAVPWPAEWSDLPVHRRPASQLRGAGGSRTPSLSSWVTSQ